MSNELLSDVSTPPPANVKTAKGKNIWYLGIDIGTSGLSAALLNRESGEVYPIYWRAAELLSVSGSPIERWFRLPTTVYRYPENGEWRVRADAGNGETGETGLWLSGFKPYLKVGLIGCRGGAQITRWQPIVQYTEQEAIPLSWMLSALQALLVTLTSGAAAEGLERMALGTAMGQLAGVIVNYPAMWADSYCFNLAEAILAAGLVEYPGQIAFVEESLAALLSVLPAGDGSTLRLPGSSSFFNSYLPGVTLVVCSGATTTELAIASMPENPQEFCYSNLTFRSFPYAGDALEQDILCQLLLCLPKQNFNYEENLQAADLFLYSPEIWPHVGEPDLEKRYRLQQFCRANSKAASLLEMARYLKVGLQYRERLALEVGSQRLVFSRRELESRVFLPFVQRLNRELNALLTETGVPVQRINRAICSGGTASVGVLARWLRQKLPNAIIIQDTYASARPLACSRIAYGLAAVPLHPRIVNTYRFQYSDAFLLTEILRTLLQKFSLADTNPSFSQEEILLLLERRGINTNVVRERIGRFLDGYLPTFLQPAFEERVLLNPDFKENPDYLALSKTPLFYQQQQLYHVNLSQARLLSQYFNDLMAGSYQRLDEPLIIELVRR
ncbi:MAG: hypothetical protein N3E45_00965 [Oscillatoriaceae bacterium SKW80]|nr:hypothetical protein [Oscillatoriaceae bacterium SKYG93]MCX8119400.1 hypothetical protein [Oscillatoriaceae bacterium SKW80]MDW8454867.1 hypothetical protein [Oscillatoriaceae cyanobacterium SKYGB_i_bin93]HIK28354.1 hypothetical protein [Oscillatoriaceae cyanobacterium M7585_C2015_266]